MAVEPKDPTGPLGMPPPVMPNAVRRARAYLAACAPDAVPDACLIGPGFALEEPLAYAVLLEDYQPRCAAPITERELAEMLSEVYEANRGRLGWLLHRPDRDEPPPPEDDDAPLADVIPIGDGRIEIEGVQPGLEGVNTLLRNRLELVLHGNREPLRLNRLSQTIDQARPAVDGEPSPGPLQWELRNLVTTIRLEAEKHICYPTGKVNAVTGEKLSAKLRLGKQDVEDIAILLAQERAYSPVVEWLEALPPVRPGAIAQTAVEALHCSDNDGLSMLLWRRWLIGAVARAMEPGCKFDTALVLVAREGGEKKSSIFRALAGGPTPKSTAWFSDTHLDFHGFRRQDSYMQLHSVWIYEIPELDGTKTEAQRGTQKSFISTQDDNFRAPYDAAVCRHPRHTAFGATTNSLSFLSPIDPAFNRRLWPIRLEEEADVKMITERRPEIWREALDAYRMGERYWIERSSEEEGMLDALAERHDLLSMAHPWTDPIEAWLRKQDPTTLPVTTERALEEVVHMRIADQDSDAQGTVAEIFRQAGWELTRRRQPDGTRPRQWIRKQKKRAHRDESNANA